MSNTFSPSQISLPQPSTKSPSSSAVSRLHWIDLTRSFACLCVIISHAPIPGGANLFGILSFSNYYSVSGASVLFFMISGALVLNKPQSFAAFLKTRLTRIFLPMVIWSIIILISNAIYHHQSISEFLSKISVIPFAPVVGVYWFIYTIMGIYLLTPILSHWLNSSTKRDCEIVLSLWFITLLIPYIKIFYPPICSVVDNIGYLFYFSGYLGYAILGFYLRRYVNISTISLNNLIFVTLVALSPWMLYLFTDIPHLTIQSRLSWNIALMASIYFLFIKHLKISPKWGNIFFNFANHTFGIYLIHHPIMRHIVWPLIEPLNLVYIIQIPLVTILTLALSYTSVELISKLPKSKYIIGL